MRWHAARSSRYVSPIVPGLGNGTKARDRILSDGELRLVWRTAETYRGPLGAYIRFLLLTATRRREAAGMRWNEIEGKSWTIPSVRYKTDRDMVVPLSAAALAVLAKLPRFDSCPYVFTHDGRRPLSASTKVLSAFQRACDVSGWSLHDLRRTSRSLMSRAGISADIAERALGHALTGVRKAYDRHDYFDEKFLAFEAVAALIERIVYPPASNVVPIREEIPA